MNHENKGFQYTYSAKEQAELKKIREKYTAAPQKAPLGKMEQVRRLDAAVNKKATTVSLIVGIIGTLIMGFGMSLIMTDLKEILGTATELALPIGILTGLVGMVGVILAYPLYAYTLARARKRIAPEILRLTEELIRENG